MERLAKPDGQEEMESIDYIFHIGAKPRQVQTLQQIVFRDDKTLEVPVNAREDQALPYVRPARNDVTAEDRSAQLVKPNEFQGSESDSRILSGNRSPALVPNDLAPVTSNVPLRIRIGNTTNLFGSPGESVNVEFVVTNYGPASTIFFSAEESQATDPDQVNFPVEQFLMSLSSSRASLSSNGNYTCFMNLVVPPHAAAGTRKTISFVAQASNAGGAPLSITRRIYFTVGGSNIKSTDSDAPECRVLSNDRAGQCQDQLSNPAQPEACRQVRWTSRFQIEDSQSGLKSIDERPLIVGVSQDAYFSHQNYILGTKLPVEYFFSASCCMETFALKLADVAGNQGQCYVGKLPNDPEANVDVQGASSTGIIIAIVVSAIILILVVIGAIAVIFVMKKKRKAELAEMRETPQAR
eukprot:TCALIF_08302-PA protein Name:"Protein of unknown function" AED:0.09 eAED:0.09 QI:0/0.66/0.25/0.75/1/1/4/91/409